MDMMSVLKHAFSRAGATGRFVGREVFTQRVGRHLVHTSGYGLALTRAVERGYLRVLAEETRGRDRTYEFTPQGRALLDAAGRKEGPP